MEKTSFLSKIKNSLASALRFVMKFCKKHSTLILCALVPACIMYLIYAVRGEYPFGDSCVMVLDLNGQYVWFFEALRNFVKGDASLLYSFSRALGGEFLGIYAYYLASPLSYLLALFPTDKMCEALLFLFLVKTGLCGFTFGYYMQKHLGKEKSLPIIIFSVLYALSSYAVVMQHNTMWIDAVAWLPLIALGMESLIKEGKFKLYTTFLALTLISNFYIGYMMCIFCFIYFFIYYIGHGGKEADTNNPLHEKKHFIKSLGRVALFSVIAVGIASFMLLAAYYSLNFGKTTFTDPTYEWTVNFDFLDFLYKLLPGSYDTVRPAGLPFVYCGLITLLFVPAFFISKKYTLRRKVTTLCFILVLVLSMMFTVVDLIWHGFQAPNWLNYRYSFMFCFVLCVLACRSFDEIADIPYKSLVATGGFIAILLIMLQGYENGEYIAPKTFSCILASFGFLIVILVLLAFLKKETKKRIVTALLLFVVFAEAFVAGLLNINALDEDVTYTHYSYYNGFLEKVRPITEMVQESDDSFYRMEKTIFRKTNDNMALNIRGLSGSTSTLNKETIQFLAKMGLASKSHWSKYLGGTPVVDSILGLKYIITETDDADYYAEMYEAYKTDETNGYTAYYNPYALSIAYGVNDELLDFPLGYVADEESEEDADAEESVSPIKTMISSIKAFLNGALDIEEEAYETYEDEYSSPFDRWNAILSAMVGHEVNVFVQVSTSLEVTNVSKGFYSGGEVGYKIIDSSSPATVTVSGTVPTNAHLYFYMPTQYPREVKLRLTTSEGVNTSLGTFNGAETTRIISLGTYAESTSFDLQLTLTTDNFYMKKGAKSVYYFDESAFESVMQELAQDQFVIEDYTESSFEGTITTSHNNETILTTIAYDNGWKVFVDGKEVETTKALGALVAFTIEGDAGTHEIKMVYSPRTLKVGLVISIVFILIFIAFIVFEILERKKGKKIPFITACIGISDARFTDEEWELKYPHEKENAIDVASTSVLEEKTEIADAVAETEEAKLEETKNQVVETEEAKNQVVEVIEEAPKVSNEKEENQQ